MKTFLSTIFLFVALAAQAVNVSFPFSDLIQSTDFFSASSNVVMRLKYQGAPSVYNGKIVVKDWRSFTNSYTATTIISNLVPGVYLATLTAKNTETPLTFTFPETNGVISAADYITSPTNVVSGSGYAYSMASSDSRYIRQYGTPTLGQVPTWNTNLSAYWPSNAASGGPGTTYTANPNQIDLTGNVISLITAAWLTNLNVVNLTNTGAFTNTSSADIGGAFTANGGFTVKTGASTNLDIGSATTTFYPGGVSGLLKVGTNNGKGMTYDKSANNLHVDKLGGAWNFWANGSSGDGGFGNNLYVTGSVFRAGVSLLPVYITGATAVTNSGDVTWTVTADVTTAQLLAQGASLTNFSRGTIGLALTNYINSRPLDSFSAPVGSVDIGGQKITGLATPTVGTDATTKSYVDNLVLATNNALKSYIDTKPLNTFAFPVEDLNLNGNHLTNVGSPIFLTDAATKGYVDQLGTNSTNFARGTIGTALTNKADAIGLAGTQNVAAVQTLVTANSADLANLKTFQKNYLPGANIAFSTNNGTNVTISGSASSSTSFTRTNIAVWTEDFSGTLGNWVSRSNTTWTIAGGALSVKNPNSDPFGHYLIKTNMIHGFSHWTMTCQVIPVSISSTSYGIGFGIFSANTHDDRNTFIRLICSSGNSLGTLDAFSGTSNAPVSQAGSSFGMSMSAGDLINLTITRKGGLWFALASNTVNGTIAVIQHSAQTRSTNAVYNPCAGYFAMWSAGGTQTVDNIAFSLNPVWPVSHLVLADSIGDAVGANNRADGWVNRLKLRTGDEGIQAWASPSLTLDLAVLGVTEMNLLQASNLIFSIGGNDILFGVSTASWTSNYYWLTTNITHSGTVYHCEPTPRTATAVTNLCKLIITNYQATAIDTYSPLKAAGTSFGLRGDMDGGDGTHPNSDGHATFFEAVYNKLKGW